MLCYARNYSVCFAYDLLLDLKAALSVDEKSRELVKMS